MPDASFYNRLYLLQDDALRALSGRTEFYLTGGTAISRFHYGHRYSDDLDFFLSYSKDFRGQSREVFKALKSSFPFAEMTMDTETFIRIFVGQNDELKLKIELVHDVEFHHGAFVSNEFYPLIDNPRNILSNKLSALNREAPKDVADIIEICTHEEFAWPDIFEEANQKDTWVNVISSIAVLSRMSIVELANVVQWIVRPDPMVLESRINTICSDIAKAGNNSLFPTS